MLSMISRASLLIFAAVMVAAVVAFSMMPVSVMAALDIRIKSKISGQERFYRFIRISGHTAVKLDAGVRKGVLISFRKPARAPCPLPLVSATCSFTILPFSTS